MKGDSLLLCPELERDSGYCHPITVFFLTLHSMKKFGSLWAVVRDFTQTVLEMSSVTANPAKW